MSLSRRRTIAALARLASVGALAAVAAVAALAACSNGPVDLNGRDFGTGTVTTSGGGTLAISAGNNQTVTSGSAATTPLSVRVLDANGLGVGNTQVTWLVTAGSGSVSPATSLTDTAGVASTAFTAGIVTGPATVTATVNGSTTVSFTVNVTAATTALREDRDRPRYRLAL